MSDRPVIFSTLGDAGGIGPEIVAKSLAHDEPKDGVKRLIVGPIDLFERGCHSAGVGVDLPVYDDAEEAIEAPEPVSLLDCHLQEQTSSTIGSSSEMAGIGDLAIADLAVELHNKGLIDGLVFAPVNKLSLKMGGSPFEGYKAYIANKLGVKGASAEINTIGHLWTTRVSSHVAIADVPSYVTQENVLKIIRYFEGELKRFGYDRPKIAVSGLNPHNGDGGMFGRQEIDDIGPAVEDAKKLQINVEGPFPPDTIFLTAQEENYLGVVSMYHDQCQIATKLLGFDQGVTYFGGLPFPITTPAHGTAYDIAEKGKASEQPMVNALSLMRRAVLNARGLPV